MNFYDADPLSFPEHAQYYFNILTICINLSNEQMDELCSPDINMCWYIDHITDPQPYMIVAVRMNEDEQEEINEDYGTDVTYEIEVYPHTVVETDPNLGVAWYFIEDGGLEDYNPWKF